VRHTNWMIDILDKSWFSYCLQYWFNSIQSIHPMSIYVINDDGHSQSSWIRLPWHQEVRNQISADRMDKTRFWIDLPCQCPLPLCPAPCKFQNSSFNSFNSFNIDNANRTNVNLTIS
jgi:hypothetical protein